MNQFQHSGWFPIAAAVFMLSFWTLFAIIFPMKEAYVHWVLNNNWIWINCIGFLGSLLGLFAFHSIYSKLNTSSTVDYFGYLLSISGIVILTCILFFEAFILKGIALEDPELIDLNGSFYQYPAFKIATLIGGVFLSLGVILLGFRMLSQKTFKKWKIITLMVACPLFGIVSMSGNIRLVGVILYSVSLLAIGLEMNKNVDTNRI